MKPFTIALDWRPNTNHTGFFVAQDLGYFTEEHLDVTILSTENDNYAVTPAKKVELGIADAALCPMESIVSYRTKATPFNAIAIATIFQEDISAIATLEDSGLSRPRDLDSKRYASYKARYEDQIVKAMVKNDGGSGEMDLLYPDKLGIWETLLSGNADATWIFTNWEGVQAQNKGIKLHLFKMKDYAIPYGYSPVIMVSQDRMNDDITSYSAFAKATKKGFEYAIKNPEAASQILSKYISKIDKNIDVLESQIMSSAQYGRSDSWGCMDKDKVQEFLDWLQHNGLEKTMLTAEKLMTNKLF